MRAALAAALAILGVVQATPPAAGLEPPAIYSTQRGDSWNRIFAALFTRTLKTYKTDEHPDAGPYVERGAGIFVRPMRISSRTFERFEEGDRAIEALYPSFLTRHGADAVLREPGTSTLLRALDDALSEREVRPPLDRALMQSDLWSAFDAVSPFTRARGVDAPSREAATRLAERLARLIARIALTRAEIEHLPDNYAMARSSGALPDLFAPSGPWLEVEWGKDRLHDSDEGSKMRRAARVFVRPAKPPLDEGEFLRQLGHQSVALSMVALVEQILLVDRDSHVVPTPLVSEVQVRTFSRDARGELLSTTFEQFEISRRLMRLQPLSGGFVRLEGRDPAYLPTSGNDYGFASPDFTMSAEQAPVLGTLRTRCSACHGANGSYLMSFSRIDGDSLPPPVRFPQPNDRRGRYVAEKKERRTDFADLIALTRASGR